MRVSIRKNVPNRFQIILIFVDVRLDSFTKIPQRFVRVVGCECGFHIPNQTFQKFDIDQSSIFDNFDDTLHRLVDLRIQIPVEFQSIGETKTRLVIIFKILQCFLISGRVRIDRVV